MKNNHPDPDISAPGTQSHIASATDFTGIAQNLDQAQALGDPYVQFHNNQRMQAEKKDHQK